MAKEAIGESIRKRVPIAEDLFFMPSSPNEKAHLIGCRCQACGEVFFPVREMCANCCETRMEKLALSLEGKLDSFTDANYPQQWAKQQPPFCVGWVELPEGVLVTAVLADCRVEDLHRGQTVELVLTKLYEDENGNDVITFKFRPVK